MLFRRERERERETTKCAVGLLLIFLPSLPPFPACLLHMSPPLVATATAPHVADRRRKRGGRGGEDKRGKRGGMGVREQIRRKEKQRRRQKVGGRD